MFMKNKVTDYMWHLLTYHLPLGYKVKSFTVEISQIHFQKYETKYLILNSNLKEICALFHIGCCDEMVTIII